MFSIAVIISDMLIVRGLMVMGWSASKRVNLFQLINRLVDGGRKKMKELEISIIIGLWSDERQLWLVV